MLVIYYVFSFFLNHILHYIIMLPEPPAEAAEVAAGLGQWLVLLFVIVLYYEY